MHHFIKKLPKTELHLHLEGAIPFECLWQLIEKYDQQKEVGSIEKMKEKFQYSDFPHFIETWVWKNQFLKEYEDFEFIAEKVAEDLRSQKYHYAEVFYSPGDFLKFGLQPQEISESIRKGLNKVSGVKINLITDLIRDFGPERGMRVLEQINEVKELGILGVGIGGSEQDFPPQAFTEVYVRARKLGFKTAAHAGEAAGAESIWGAVKDLKVDRIGHGTRAFEDEKLVQHLIEKQIHVEMCPISNLRTGVVDKVKSHPIGDFFKRGMNVSVNTDDPKMFNNDMCMEYEYLVEAFDWGVDEIVQLERSSIQSSWLKETEKNILLTQLEEVAREHNSSTKGS